jgi:hypothetical protein
MTFVTLPRIVRRYLAAEDAAAGMLNALVSLREVVREDLNVQQLFPTRVTGATEILLGASRRVSKSAMLLPRPRIGSMNPKYRLTVTLVTARCRFYE